MASLFIPPKDESVEMSPMNLEEIKPVLVTKIFRVKCKRVKETIFNQDKSRFAVLWKAAIK
jgi:hypothetical protein